MSKMVDLVTLAIIRAFFDREPDAGGERIFSVSPSDNEDLARAAIAAMREPTGPMIAAAFALGYEAQCAPEVWQAMIDEALK